MNNDKQNERAPTIYNIMSGDSPEYQLNKKRDEQSALLVPERMRSPIAATAGVGVAAAVAEIPSDYGISESEEKLLNNEKEESKEAAGDANKSNDYMENNDVDKFPDSNQDKSGYKQQKSTDKVDSVVLSPSSMIKPSQSSTSNPDEDDCIVKCLYYSLQCCDCVIM